MHSASSLTQVNGEDICDLISQKANREHHQLQPQAAVFVSHLLQVVELHGHFSEEKVDMRAPFHSTYEIWLCMKNMNTYKLSFNSRQRAFLRRVN